MKNIIHTQPEELKQYLKKNLEIRYQDKAIELMLENSVISSCRIEHLIPEDQSENKDEKEICMCDCCGHSHTRDFFCYICSDLERTICFNCCSCM